MADHTHIEWTDATWNPITGCSVVSAGCKHCYAMKLAGTRLQHHPSRAGLTQESKAGPVWTGEVRYNTQWLDQPLRWRDPRRIFVCAHGDLFHESVPDAWIDEVFIIMALAHQHTFQVLTKRAARMLDYLSDPGLLQRLDSTGWPTLRGPDSRRCFVQMHGVEGWPLPNVWLGVSVENQDAAEARIPALLNSPAAVRWISAEPLLGSLNLRAWLARRLRPNGDVLPHLDWVVAGGESGNGARPMHPDWVTGLRDQCAKARVPFLFKQWGEWAPRSRCYHVFDNGQSCADIDPEAKRWPVIRLTRAGTDGNVLANSDYGDDAYMQRVGKKMAGRLLEGTLHDAFPEVTNG